MGLNPCSNGRYSQSTQIDGVSNEFDLVLILVLMEDILRAHLICHFDESSIVLILVLMEDTLRVACS